MIIALPNRTFANRSTQVFEFFDPRLLGHLWFVAVSDDESVQMLAPTFRSERAARIFEYCYCNHPGAYLLTIDSQLELGRRIESRLRTEPVSGEAALRALCEGLAFETALPVHVPAYLAQVPIAHQEQ